MANALKRTSSNIASKPIVKKSDEDNKVDLMFNFVGTDAVNVRNKREISLLAPKPGRMRYSRNNYIEQQ